MPDLDYPDLDHAVVKNDEGQYSIWPADKPVPNGWSVERRRGSKDECLRYVDEVWTDMTRRSLADPNAGRAAS